jgi:hypothetical protein
MSGRSRPQDQTRQHRGVGQKCTRTPEELVFRSQSVRYRRSDGLYNDFVSGLCILAQVDLADSFGIGLCSAM